VALLLDYPAMAGSEENAGGLASRLRHVIWGRRPGMAVPFAKPLSLALTVAAVVAAAFSQSLLVAWIPGEDAQYLIAALAVLFAAAIGGLAEGVLATVLCLVYALTLSGNAINSATVANAAAFAIFGFGLSALGEALHHMRYRAVQATQRLRSREALLTSILETVPDAVLITDENGIIRSFGGAAERMFGFTAVEFPGMSFFSLVPDAEFDPEAVAPIKQLSQFGHGARKDGSEFPLEIASGTMNAGTGHFINIFIRDLTERRQTESRLANLQSDLVHASRLTAMGEMASALAHELNQPLSSISNYLRGLQRLGQASSEDRDAAMGTVIDATVAQAMRAGQIISRLRNFVSRGDTERRVENLNTLVEEATALALIGFRDANIHVQFRLDRHQDVVLADRVQLQQVVFNLVRNAIEATAPEAQRLITVATETDPPDWLVVRISDNGPGLSKDVESHIFEPFTTTKRDGMGVGLSISRTIVASHGGRLWHEETPGGGATFCFAVPRMMNEDVEHAA
jgi:two-component system, LuxR family, sensor kinase FixL